MSNLVGIGLSQVPTNSMLGGLAYQDPEYASIKDLDLKNLSQINSEIADTAVDVFVYDTRKDSDGGAWRKRTQNTSWYNETLGTATRGTRKEFPAVAVIVTELTKVTIYDGDDPDLPMWMVFTWVGTSPISALGYNNRPKSATKMINGQLVTCGDPDGLHIARFVHDDVIRYTHTAQFKTTDAISKRTNSYTTPPTINTSSLLRASTCNDIAATVLPNAPIDSATGLPVPTIAVATKSGVSVIKDNGTVVDPGDASNTRKIAFNNTTTLVTSIANNTIRTFDDVGGLTDSSSATRTYFTDSSSSTIPAFGGVTLGEPLISSNGNGIFGVTNKNGSTSNTALTFLSESGTTQSSNMVAYIASDYNTGYMHGDIKGAFLSDTDTTNVTGSELITNPGPNFSDTSGWGATNGSLSISSGDLLLTGANNVNEHMYSTGFTLTSGKTYVLSIDSNQLFSYVRIGTTTALGTSEQLNTSAGSGLSSHTFTATASGTFYLKLGMVTSYVTGSINSVSLRLAEEDRSVNNNGLAVHGTITKSVVATGADLVAYSGFSNSNQLGNTSSYNFGSGSTVSMCIVSWFKITSISAYAYILSVYNSTTDKVAGLAINSTDSSSPHPAGTLYTYDNDNTQQTSGTTVVNDGQWHCAIGIFNGATREIYLDGKLEISTTYTSFALDITNVDKLGVGRYTYTDAFPFLGSLALTRISKSIPSPEQIKKMYEDEKVLFQENAKATLYGSSDAVTALGYDEDTELLHVGTSAGRSDFQGLRRINNTTDAVTTAISASNGLVAEQ